MILEKLHGQDRFDLTLQPQGQSQNGDFAVLAKLETLELADGSLQTKRKVSIFGTGKTLKAAQNNALKEAVRLLGI
jgi:hypothetical protein